MPLHYKTLSTAASSGMSSTTENTHERLQRLCRALRSPEPTNTPPLTTSQSNREEMSVDGLIGAIESLIHEENHSDISTLLSQISNLAMALPWNNDDATAVRNKAGRYDHANSKKLQPDGIDWDLLANFKLLLPETIRELEIQNELQVILKKLETIKRWMPRKNLPIPFSSNEIPEITRNVYMTILHTKTNELGHLCAYWKDVKQFLNNPDASSGSYVKWAIFRLIGLLGETSKTILQCLNELSPLHYHRPIDHHIGVPAALKEFATLRDQLAHGSSVKKRILIWASDVHLDALPLALQAFYENLLQAPHGHPACTFSLPAFQTSQRPKTDEPPPAIDLSIPTREVAARLLALRKQEDPTLCKHPNYKRSEKELSSLLFKPTLWNQLIDELVCAYANQNMKSNPVFKCIEALTGYIVTEHQHDQEPIDDHVIVAHLRQIQPYLELLQALIPRQSKADTMSFPTKFLSMVLVQTLPLGTHQDRFGAVTATLKAHQPEIRKRCEANFSTPISDQPTAATDPLWQEIERAILTYRSQYIKPAQPDILDKDLASSTSSTETNTAELRTATHGHFEKIFRLISDLILMLKVPPTNFSGTLFWESEDTLLAFLSIAELNHVPSPSPASAPQPSELLSLLASQYVISEIGETMRRILENLQTPKLKLDMTTHYTAQFRRLILLRNKLMHEFGNPDTETILTHSVRLLFTLKHSLGHLQNLLAPENDTFLSTLIETGNQVAGYKTVQKMLEQNLDLSPHVIPILDLVSKQPYSELLFIEALTLCDSLLSTPSIHFSLALYDLKFIFIQALYWNINRQTSDYPLIQTEYLAYAHDTSQLLSSFSTENPLFVPSRRLYVQCLLVLLDHHTLSYEDYQTHLLNCFVGLKSLDTHFDETLSIALHEIAFYRVHALCYKPQSFQDAKVALGELQGSLQQAHISHSSAQIARTLYFMESILCPSLSLILDSNMIFTDPQRYKKSLETLQQLVAETSDLPIHYQRMLSQRFEMCAQALAQPHSVSEETSLTSASSSRETPSPVQRHRLSPNRHKPIKKKRRPSLSAAQATSLPSLTNRYEKLIELLTQFKREAADTDSPPSQTIARLEAIDTSEFCSALPRSGRHIDLTDPFHQSIFQYILNILSATHIKNQHAQAFSERLEPQFISLFETIATPLSDADTIEMIKARLNFFHPLFTVTRQNTEQSLCFSPHFYEKYRVLILQFAQELVKDIIRTKNPVFLTLFLKEIIKFSPSSYSGINWNRSVLIHGLYDMVLNHPAFLTSLFAQTPSKNLNSHLRTLVAYSLKFYMEDIFKVKGYEGANDFVLKVGQQFESILTSSAFQLGLDDFLKSKGSYNQLRQNYFSLERYIIQVSGVKLRL